MPALAPYMGPQDQVPVRGYLDAPCACQLTQTVDLRQSILDASTCVDMVKQPWRHGRPHARIQSISDISVTAGHMRKIAIAEEVHMWTILACRMIHIYMQLHACKHVCVCGM